MKRQKGEMNFPKDELMMSDLTDIPFFPYKPFKEEFKEEKSSVDQGMTFIYQSKYFRPEGCKKHIEIDVKTGIDKKIVISIIIFVIVSVLVSGAFVLFSKYTLVNDNIKDAAWTNGTFSIINKEYKCSVDDISTGDLVLYTDSNNVYFKTYNYATIIDTSLSNPRKIKVIINKTGEQSYLSIENIYYVVKPSGDYDYVKVE